MKHKNSGHIILYCIIILCLLTAGCTQQQKLHQAQFAEELTPLEFEQWAEFCENCLGMSRDELIDLYFPELQEQIHLLTDEENENYSIRVGDIWISDDVIEVTGEHEEMLNSNFLISADNEVLGVTKLYYNYYTDNTKLEDDILYIFDLYEKYTGDTEWVALSLDHNYENEFDVKKWEEGWMEDLIEVMEKEGRPSATSLDIPMVIYLYSEKYPPGMRLLNNPYFFLTIEYDEKDQKIERSSLNIQISFWLQE